MKSLDCILCFGLFLCAQWGVSQQMQPIRVGGNVQESKLIHKVEPVYPESARAARITGVVILQVTVNEQGEVADIRVLRGHPLLDQAAMDAVRQWRYSPTYLNGVAIPVIATVSVAFSPSPQLSLTLDENGNLREPVSGLEGDALIQKLKTDQAAVRVNHGPTVPFRIVEETLKALTAQGIQCWTSGPYLFHKGRLFYLTAGLTGPPELALDMARLAELGRNYPGVPVDPDLQRTVRLVYRLFLTETGEVHDVERLQAPNIPEIEAELARTRVVTPGLLGRDPVPAVVVVEIPVKE